MGASESTVTSCERTTGVTILKVAGLHNASIFLSVCMKLKLCLSRFGWAVTSILLVSMLGVFYVCWLRPAMLSRESLLAVVRPVRLTNCTMQRFGGMNDGGYLMCANLLNQAQVAYSYGIDGRDEWGCEISRQYHLKVHQYDCFNTTKPVCSGGDFTFHPECIGASTQVVDGRPFDSMVTQIRRNGDENKRIVMKMDVEGAEWESLAATPDHQLALIDQMSIEFHGVSLAEYRALLERLKQHFYIVDVHINNFTCDWRSWPMPGWVFELLLVNRRLGIPDTKAFANEPTPHPLSQPNNPHNEDCQIEWR